VNYGSRPSLNGLKGTMWLPPPVTPEYTLPQNGGRVNSKTRVIPDIPWGICLKIWMHHECNVLAQ